MEVRVAFDRPLADFVLEELSGGELQFGDYVRAADRFEVLKPPYKVVQHQEATPRGKIRVVAARLERDRRTLVLATGPHPQAATYAMTLPSVRGAGTKSELTTVDLDYDLHGLEATWSGRNDSQPKWTGWLPHLEAGVNGAFTVHSSAHEELSGWAAKPGLLTLHGRLALPEGATKIRLERDAPFS
jgi:hypothetical protein